jgi:hypothetical protein
VHSRCVFSGLRGADFYPSALEKSSRSERALKVAIAEMYLRFHVVKTYEFWFITKTLIDIQLLLPRISPDRFRAGGLVEPDGFIGVP